MGEFPKGIMPLSKEKIEKAWGLQFMQYKHYENECQRIKKAVKTYYKIDISLAQAYYFWTNYSESLCMGFMSLPECDKSIAICIAESIQEILHIDLQGDKQTS